MSQEDIFNLEGKIAIVTGSAQGLGQSMAIGLARYGCDVVIADIKTNKAQKVAETIKELGRKATIYNIDVSKIGQISKMVNEVVQEFHQIDILVNSAGIVIRKLVEDIKEKDWDAILDVNLKGTFFCCQIVGKQMIEQNKGKIINIASVSSIRGLPTRSVYAASKAGVAHVTRSIAIEWAKYNINVNCISPTVMETPLNVSIRNSKEKYDKLVSEIPMRRLGQPEDLIGAVVYLASRASDFVTGHNLVVDGGRTIY